ncbi:MAG: AbrB/MazE/SpoVT family DNA-binding domain-containing protein [Euryarchaeota archaeon]|nr:AbrB/MazE/SpoVT family DNA-binding domain-containing protein [Euryarchaeota archaeon]
MPTVTVDRRGRITLPGEFRRLFGLQPGSAVRVDAEEEGLRLTRAGEGGERDTFLEWARNHPIDIGRKVTAAEIRRLRDEMWNT